MISLGLIELTIRRSVAPNLYLLNKSVAGTAFLMIAISYTFSAIDCFTRGFKTGLALRRPFGLAGYGFAVLHIFLTLIVADPEYPLLKKFQFPTYFIDHWMAISFALPALGYFSYALKISLWPGNMIKGAESSKRWRRRLRYGYIAVCLVFIHATLLKFEGWIAWMVSFVPVLPPLSLIVAVIGLGLIVLKILHLYKVQRLF